MRWIKIEFLKLNKNNFKEAFNTLSKSFPYEEIRTFEDEEKCFLKNEFNFCEIFDGNVSVGITAFWKFEDFLYVEHIAINEENRGEGYGTKTFEYLKQKYDLPIILEAEIPENETQKRRIKFYGNLGFEMNDYKYFQPPYHEDTEPLELKILSFPKLLNESEFKKFAEVTRKTVYGVN